jgi:hypothetical protein
MVKEIPIWQHVSSAARRALGHGRLISSQATEFKSAVKIGMPNVSGFLNRWKPEAVP